MALSWHLPQSEIARVPRISERSSRATPFATLETMAAAIAFGALALQGYAPAAYTAPTLRTAHTRAAIPELSLTRRVQSAAFGAALAASLSLNPANAADPWPYSTLLSKVNADEVAKVRPRPRTPSPPRWGGGRRRFPHGKTQALSSLTPGGDAGAANAR